MSDYLVTVKSSAQKQLNSLPVEIRSRIIAKMMALSTNPRPEGCLKLKGTSNRWRIRAGDYRVIYSIDDATFIIYILRVAHRRHVYD
ncbi:MAG: type II toxin-antitoxin system RelE/ParE family toxin [Oscillatoria princeps RMCB-10]|jgi:mRNA interferase RelE/StbE|nr:type II toxin-antitoxin system RelE/ParE family toxin [Oscillatoria princeps RMCB-10]